MAAYYAALRGQPEDYQNLAWHGSRWQQQSLDITTEARLLASFIW